MACQSSAATSSPCTTFPERQSYFVRQLAEGDIYIDFLPSLFDSFSTSVSCILAKTCLSYFLSCCLWWLYPQCKLDEDSTICSASKNTVSFQFPLQQAWSLCSARGSWTRGCAVIHPKVKSTLSPGSLLCCTAKPWRKRQRGLASGRMLRNRMFRVCARVQSAEMEGGTPRATLSVLVVYRMLTRRENGRSTRSG